MVSLQLLQIILNASSQAFAVSQTAAYTEEIVDGGTKNRIWSFFMTYSLTNLALFPLMLLFPAMSFGLVLLGTAVVLGGIFYTASIAQENQMAVNQGELEKIRTLPWGLHENQYLMKSALFLSLHLKTPLLLLYGLSLVACIFLGHPLYAYVSLGMYAVNQLNQHGYMPNVLKTPYLYLAVAVSLLAVFGVTSVLGLTLSFSLLAFTAMDYIRCYLWGAGSPTAQFPMTDLSRQIKVPSCETDDVEATQQFKDLLQTRQRKGYELCLMSNRTRIKLGALYITDLGEDGIKYTVRNNNQIITGTIDAQELSTFGISVPFPQYSMIKQLRPKLSDILNITSKRGHTRDESKLQVTFDHFYASHHIVNRLLEGAPAIDYKKYITLFNAIDFTDETFQNNMINEMCLHDKFNGQEGLEGLSKEALVERQVTYLKQEMIYFVERLEQPSYRDFTYEQAATMHRYARLLFSKIEGSSRDKQALYLLQIAMTTGSHCNRMYLESLSALTANEHLLVTQSSLSFHDEAILRVQDVREDAFRRYYHEVAPILRDNNLYFGVIWADTGDYHTYEDFVQIFGANFYLRNSSFTTGFRSVFDVLVDRIVALLTKMDAGMLFCERYTVDYLVEQTITPGKKLYNIFERWCTEHHVDLCPLDEDFMPIARDEDELRALAELMLLDLNIIDVKKPAASRYTLFQPAPLVIDHDETLSCGYDA